VNEVTTRLIHLFSHVHTSLRSAAGRKVHLVQRGSYRAFLERVDHYPLAKDLNEDEKKDWEEAYRTTLNRLLLAARPSVVEETLRIHRDKEVYLNAEHLKRKRMEEMRKDVYRGVN